MVGLVLVSHSRPLAEALRNLLQQVASAELAVSVAAGAGVDHQDFGTDSLEIAHAIQSVYSEDGVVVLMDLGSAVLSAEMALEFLPGEQQAKVRCCPGALVEGAIAAAVQAGAGGDLEQVYREASRALDPKVEHLETRIPGTDFGPQSGLTAPIEETHSIVLTLHNEHGLHARPAARFVKAAAAYQADILVTNLRSGKGPASARSLNALATLGASSGDRISIAASGPDADQVLAALRQLVDNNFDLSESPGVAESSLLQRERTQKQPDSNSYKGLPLAEGIALGPLSYFSFEIPEFTGQEPGDPGQEWQRLQQALEQTRERIELRRLDTLSRAGELQAEIFAAHLLILDDPDLQAELKERILHNRQPAGLAWQKSINLAIEAYRALEDPYLRARSKDVRDVGEQVSLALQGDSDVLPIQLDQPGILWLDTMTPTRVVQLDQAQVLGLVVTSCGPTSHSAILARALGIPAVSGVDLKELGLNPGTQIAIDGFSGEIWVDPDQAKLDKISRRKKAWQDQRQHLLEAGREPAMTRDGQRIEVAANVGSLAEAWAAKKNGAEAIGVVRTEFLYLSRSEPPGEVEQVAVLTQIARTMNGQRVIVRTLDVGGDKLLPYIQRPREANPYLGVRGLRLSIQQPELFQVQLRAILRAGAEYPLSVMFPMISTLGDLVWAKDQLAAAHQSLDSEGVPHRWPVETGIMVEVPSVALTAASIAPLIDFFSIGTNDLTQYTLAAERGNPSLAGLADALHPAILTLIKQVVEAAHTAGKWVGVCGEIAADPLATPILVGLGVDELSMNPAGIPLVKSAIRRLDLRQAGDWAHRALACSEAQQVRSIVQISP